MADPADRHPAHRHPADRPNPVEYVLAAYAVVAGAALAFPHRPGAWPLIALGHLLAAAILLRLPPFRSLWRTASARAPRAARAVALWYPIVVIPLVYGELDVLNMAVWGGQFFDPVILHWEQALFGAQPAVTMAYQAPYLLLSELLHASYLSYYFIIYGPPFLLFIAGRHDDMARMVFALVFGFLAHYVVFVYFPVQGPRYLFPAPDAGDIARGPLYRLTHIVLEQGSSRGSAFPSSHMAVAVVQTVVAFRYLPRLAPLVMAATIGLGVGAVYGGFHYATDVLVGAATGGLVAAVAPAVYRVLDGDRTGERTYERTVDGVADRAEDRTPAT